ncbi:MAG: Crp/Fnr family transcriptional regulator [Spirochaetaceae bacterium]|jgi:CRP-like cAMP-binding protein|nr:Crp/Fnr family transcriptional regulator [Spirochaetaceae bacterium]
MPKSNPYKKGSIVYFHGDRADKIFVLQSGAVNLTVNDIETGEEINDIVQTGEFFGVKSALGGYPREEIATVLADSMVMTFTVPEFEAFAKNNPRIVLKMLKVFSTQLREVNARLSLLTKDGQTDPDNGLYGISMFYIKQRKTKEALYVLKKYIEMYPKGKNIENVKAYYAKISGGK